MRILLVIMVVSLLVGGFFSVGVEARTLAETQKIIDESNSKTPVVTTFGELVRMEPKEFKEAVDNMGGADLCEMTKEIANLIVIRMKIQGLDRNLLKTIFSDAGARIRFRKELAKISGATLRPVFGNVLKKVMLDLMIIELTYNLLDRLEVYAVTGM